MTERALSDPPENVPGRPLMDAWVVVRVLGDGGSTFPLISASVGFDDTAADPESFITSDGGAPPFAMLGAFRVDADGDGSYRAPYHDGNFTGE